MNMTPDQLSAFLTSGDLYLALASFSFLVVRVLDVYTPATMFTSALSKRVAAGVVSVVTPILVAMPAGLIAHFPPLKLASLALFSFFGSSAFNAWLPIKPSANVAPPGDTVGTMKIERITVTPSPEKSDPPKGAARRRLDHRVIAPLFATLLICFAAIGCSSCTAAQGQAVIAAIPGIVQTICTIADAQTEPGQAMLSCQGIDAQGKPVGAPTLAKVSKSVLASCPKTDGKLTP